MAALVWVHRGWEWYSVLSRVKQICSQVLALPFTGCRPQPNKCGAWGKNPNDGLYTLYGHVFENYKSNHFFFYPDKYTFIMIWRVVFEFEYLDTSESFLERYYIRRIGPRLAFHFVSIACWCLCHNTRVDMPAHKPRLYLSYSKSHPLSTPWT